MLIEWAAIAAILLGAMIFCARIMRKGITTLDEDRRLYLERIHEEEHRIAEDRKNISSTEHLQIMRAAVEDLLRLEGNPEGYAIKGQGRAITLETPKGPWTIELVMRERSLKSCGRTLHGKSRWRLEGCGQSEDHDSPASLMQCLHAHLRTNEQSPAPEPPHLAARLAPLPSARRMA